MALRLSYLNYAAGADLTASSETAGNEAALVQNPHLYRTWLTGTSTALESLVFDFGEAKSVGVAAILGHDLDDADSGVAIEANSADSWGAPAFSQSFTRGRDGALVEYFAAAQSYRYWRYVFTKQAAGDQREVGLVWLGPAYHCARDFRPGGKIHPVDLSDTARSPYGPTWSEVRGSYESVELQFDAAPQAQATQFQAMAATAGRHSPVLVSGDHARRPLEWLWYGKLTRLDGAALTSVPDPAGGHYWDLRLALETEP